MENFKGIIRINGKAYNVEVINGERFVEGKSIDEFLDTLPLIDLCELAKMGKLVIERDDVSPQKIMDEFHQTKNN